MRRFGFALVVLIALTVAIAHGQTRKAPTTAPVPFTTALTPAQTAHKQAVVETTLGTFVIALLAGVAPNHVGYFMKLAQDGAYADTTFHRAVRMAIVQGGDPLSKDPSKAPMVGTGGFGALKAEFNSTPMARGAVAAALQPGRPDSGGAQFFIAVSDQLALNGSTPSMGRSSKGWRSSRRSPEAQVDAQGRVTDRIEITKVTIRDAPPPAAIPFSTGNSGGAVEGPRRSRNVKRRYHDLIPARQGARARAQLPAARLRRCVHGTTFHRVVHGFVIQTGMVSTRGAPLTQTQQAYVHTLQPEFNDIAHVAGTVSMARLDNPASASTSFFICTGRAPSLDGKDSAFGSVVSGQDVVSAIDQVPVDGDKPRERSNCATCG